MAELVLEGTAALIPGGGSGIGLACARHLLRDGASVTIAGRTQTRVDAAAEELPAEVPAGGHAGRGAGGGGAGWGGGAVRPFRRRSGGRRRGGRRRCRGGHRRSPALRGLRGH